MGKMHKELANLVFKHGIPAWEQGDYRFLFQHGEYFWKGRKIGITAYQAVYLYYRLVLGKRFGPHSQSLYALRRRYGAGFLSEVVPVYAAMRREGRKSDLAYELDGSYYRNIIRRKQ